MVFSSITFIYIFLPTVLAGYYMIPEKWKNFWLFLASLLFYFWGEPKHIFFIIGAVIWNYVWGNLIARHKKWARCFLWISVGGLTGSLILFKYTDFFLLNVQKGLGIDLPLLSLTLPIGISFFTFQGISYLADIYTGREKPEKNLITFGMYLCLFPQLIAGPIVRYQEVSKDLLKRERNWENLSYGAMRFITGLSKKILFADSFGELCSIILASKEKTILFYWMYAVAFMLQIYFDFSGYSDMAIGLGRMFGFHFPENFLYPYMAKSITQFWQCWHQTLGRWFRDYVYIPLGGNRTKTIFWIRNVLCVWMLTGLWHGADWNFLIWGLYFGVILMIEKLLRKKSKRTLPDVWKHLYVCLVVCVGFVIFSQSDVKTLAEMLGGMIGLKEINFFGRETLYYLKSYSFLFLFGVIGSTCLGKKIWDYVGTYKKGLFVRERIQPLLLLGLWLLCMASLLKASFQPFLYFRF